MTRLASLATPASTAPKHTVMTVYIRTSGRTFSGTFLPGGELDEKMFGDRANIRGETAGLLVLFLAARLTDEPERLSQLIATAFFFFCTDSSAVCDRHCHL